MHVDFRFCSVVDVSRPNKLVCFYCKYSEDWIFTEILKKLHFIPKTLFRCSLCR